MTVVPPFMSDPAVQNMLIKAQNGNSGACTPTPEKMKTLATAAATDQNMEAIAKSMGMDAVCTKNNYNKTKADLSNTQTLGVAVTLFGGGGVATNTNKDVTEGEDEQFETGCGSFGLTANKMIASTEAISCTLNQSLTGDEVTISSGTNIRIRTIRPGLEAIEEANKSVTRMMNSTTTSPRIPPGASQETVRYIYDVHRRINEAKLMSIDKFIEGNSMNADFTDSSVDIKIQSDMKIRKTQNISADARKDLERNIKNIAGARASSDLEQNFGFRASDPNTKNVINTYIDKSYTENRKSIEEKIVNSRLNVDENNNITIDVQGSIKNLTFKVDLLAQTNIQTEQAVSSALQLGERVYNEIAGDIVSDQKAKSTVKGLDDMTEKFYDGVAKIKAEQDAFGEGGMGGAMGSVFSGIGSMFSGGLLFLLIPVLIIGMIFMGGPGKILGAITGGGGGGGSGGGGSGSGGWGPWKWWLVINLLVVVVLTAVGLVYWFNYTDEDDNTSTSVEPRLKPKLRDTSDVYFKAEMGSLTSSKPYSNNKIFTPGGVFKI